ncbi:Phosphatidylserine decarboxylase proenzyme [Pseudovibrio sp. Ad13]|uniref:phosphatidylserine decarboxylase family protein n=1 Tax=Pseudovibrio sp. Ad13 TaxID=989396 RepID=UPI0007B309C5|nr:phosphatidylserine decarboxylase family protein [Pseudovibrio sp. Ad13]KZK81990.1 Phosphatidylserine decarboxylase proenzyme [Pseudovibrio sp. Ad13]
MPKGQFQSHHENRPGVIAGFLPRDSKLLGKWLDHISKKSISAYGEQIERGYSFLEPSVQALAFLLNEGDHLHGLASEMIEQGWQVHQEEEPKVAYGIKSINNMLCALNYIIKHAPIFDPDLPHSAFPMSGLFVYMMWTPAGNFIFKNKLFNDALRNILDAWCEFLDSPASLSVVVTSKDGWLSEASWKANSLDQFVTKEQIEKDPVHWGYTSFNDFFHRQIIAICRPIDGPDNDRVITSANDGTVYRIARNVKLDDDFETKAQNYSLKQMLDDSPLTTHFVGGDVVQTFLSGNDYHRWRAPIAGKVVEARVVNGYMFSELYSEGFDPSAGTKSQGYEAMVNTRALIFIESENPAIGCVCVMPIGITEISSISIQVKVGDNVQKGQELGWFSYGGSSMALVFQPKAIKQFTIVNPLSDNNSDNGPFVRVGAQIAISTI